MAHWQWGQCRTAGATLDSHAMQPMPCEPTLPMPCKRHARHHLNALRMCRHMLLMRTCCTGQPTAMRPVRQGENSRTGQGPRSHFQHQMARAQHKSWAGQHKTSCPPSLASNLMQSVCPTSARSHHKPSHSCSGPQSLLNTTLWQPTACLLRLQPPLRLPPPPPPCQQAPAVAARSSGSKARPFHNLGLSLGVSNRHLGAIHCQVCFPRVCWGY